MLDALPREMCLNVWVERISVMIAAAARKIDVGFFLLPRTKAPNTLFGSVRLCTPSLVDLERILDAILLSRTYSKLQNLLGIVTNVTDLVPTEQRILKCSNFGKYLSEQGGMSSALNQGTETNSYRVTTYTGD
jgi:hypothetical protein